MARYYSDVNGVINEGLECCKISDQEFTVVRRKSRFKGRCYLKNGCPYNPDCNRFCPDRGIISEKISACRLQLQKTVFFEEVKCLLESEFPLSGVNTVVCYGIGHIGSCHIALHQFGLLMELMTPYQLQNVIVYDPVLQEEEKAAITELGCKIAPRNEKCKHVVQDKTLFFMPHCGKAMYNNVLWANWTVHRLSNIGIIGNSFSSYHDKFPSQQLIAEATYIYKIHSACSEHPLPNTYPDSTIFNDTSLHLFSSEILSTFPEDFWLSCPEPILDSNDTEIITEDH